MKLWHRKPRVKRFSIITLNQNHSKFCKMFWFHWISNRYQNHPFFQIFNVHRDGIIEWLPEKLEDVTHKDNFFEDFGICYKFFFSCEKSHKSLLSWTPSDDKVIDHDSPLWDYFSVVIVSSPVTVWEES